jgi:transcriptional regulator with XRE-family HTH domain
MATTTDKILPPDVDGEAPSDALLLAIARARLAGRPTYALAAEMPIHPSELSRWLSGRRQPTRDQAQRLAGLLGCDARELFPSLECDDTSG